MRRAAKVGLITASILTAAGPGLNASAAVRHHPRQHYSRGTPGLPITEGASDVRINSVGEVIAPVVGAQVPVDK